MEMLSAAQLRQDSAAAEQIEGDRAFRILNGYDSLPLWLLRSIPNHSSVVEVNSIVEQIEWTHAHATVHYRSALGNEPQILRCRRVIVTVSLGVLQSGGIQFDPAPGNVLEAVRALGFGQVYRVTFRFDNAFWEEDERFKSAGFLISQDKPFFTWWTTQPVVSTTLTGWCAGAAAELLQGARRPVIFAEALACLGRIINRQIPVPRAAWLEDWHANRFFLGAYSHVPVDGMAARDVLAEPLEGTLFFAGEAANNMGHGSTVHGAIASGMRAAQQILHK
jgi:monoamine oxidase